MRLTAIFILRHGVNSNNTLNKSPKYQFGREEIIDEKWIKFYFSKVISVFLKHEFVTFIG